MSRNAVYWMGKVGRTDDFGAPIYGSFVDGVTSTGRWAIMSTLSYTMYGRGLGTGFGQRYEKQADNRWLKVEG